MRYAFALLAASALAGCGTPPQTHDYGGVVGVAPPSLASRDWRAAFAGAAIGPVPRAEDLPTGECVPFARALSGVDLVGDAWTWWAQAAGRYERGARPEPGAVMVFQATEDMPLGHVAVVTAMLNARQMLVSHRNWSGGLEKARIDLDRLVEDVSARNDWSQVRVWHEATRRLGPNAHRLQGFIYRQSVGFQTARR